MFLKKRERKKLQMISNKEKMNMASAKASWVSTITENE